ncbi:MAG: ABC transporter ATP-binding protein [Eubacterium sp.]|nr:ABC transporter ATP-binding protein [Eubacterium sp.]
MLKTLTAHIKEFKVPTILTPVCMAGEVVFEMLIPLLMASIIDNGVQAGNMRHIVTTGLLMLLMAAGGLATGVLGGVFGARASTGFARNLREAMFNNIQTFSFSNIDKFSTPSLITRLTTDITNIQMAFQMILRMFVRAPMSLITAMVMAFIINARLARIYLAAVVILAFFLFLIIRKATGYFQKIFPRYDDLNESIEENVRGIRVVKSFVREGYETDKLKKASSNIYKLFTKAERMVILNAPLMQITVYTCIILISWLGAKMIVVGDLTTGQMMSLLTYCMNILMSLMMLSMVFVMITLSQASAKRVCEVLNETADITNPEQPVMEVADGSIEFRNVSFSYKTGADGTDGDPEAADAAGLKTGLAGPGMEENGGNTSRSVLHNINLSISAGETIGIIGGTGSGKTSLVNLLSRLYDVDEGEVLVGGRDVRTYDLDTIRSKVAVVLQKNVLFSGSVLDNLRWGDENATLEDCRRVCRIACADEFIDAMPEGYNTRIEQGGSNVSGGQKQRLCIARALLKAPKVIIFDDSTSAVDTATDAKIRASLASELPGTTKIIIAQRISSIAHADRVIVMEDGHVDAFDTPENLLANNQIYQEVYESQVGGNADFDEMMPEGETHVHASRGGEA